ncbi:HD domain-containing protein [Tessaracoccus defluvii]|uniref:Metal-dependent phosphohydrolase n=1 Tax=Tessaracoccus defluvii TaxID=1285901 RepID=A0A7H0H646_9ACTN|nr:metal-dependent phosphohydrolase [Tessaracoccus defluvii]QNP56012.1 metal-dependent phosphohydrolase [Tessaracoccus defluvii]
MVTLPEQIREALLVRWREPRRRYHGETHLRDGLNALRRLGGGEVEQIAFWFHDAVQTGATPADELASADLVDELLGGILPSHMVGEVRRLVLLTIDHRAEAGDGAGARVCDADLHGLGSAPSRYLANVEGVRAEVPHLGEGEWRAARLRFVEGMLARPHIFATPTGRGLWEEAARANLAREAGALLRGSALGE